MNSNDWKTLYEAVDGFICFLHKVNRICKVENLLKMLRKFIGKGLVCIQCSLDLIFLRRVFYFARDFLQISYIAEEPELFHFNQLQNQRKRVNNDIIMSYRVDNLCYHLSLNFKKYKRSKNQRVKMFETRLRELGQTAIERIPLIDIPARPQILKDRIEIDSRKKKIKLTANCEDQTKTFNPVSSIELLKSESFYQSQIKGEVVFNKKSAVFKTLSRPLASKLQETLRKKGIQRLYKHQVDAIELIRASSYSKLRGCIMTTGTSSGKTFAFLLPILERLLESTVEYSILIYPTKALAQDQLAKIQDMLLSVGLPSTFAISFDGDLDFNQRGNIVESRIILTNPDMIHHSILKNISTFKPVLQKLTFLVLDEAHVYSGVFGSHVALILRRLIRACTYYQQLIGGIKRAVNIICCTATIGNPVDHFVNLFGDRISKKDILVIRKDYSPKGIHRLCLWKPPIKTSKELAENRYSTLCEAARVCSSLLRQQLSILVFANSRKTVELILKYTKRILEKDNLKELVSLVAAYRAGYTKEERRTLERRMFDGKIQLIVATNALEVGIDIGHLDCVITVGFPGRISTLLQQIGRAGRGGRNALSIVVCFDSPVDNYYLKNLNLLENDNLVPEKILINPMNSCLLRSHLACATQEIPLILEVNRKAKTVFLKDNIFPESLGRFVQFLLNKGILRIVSKIMLKQRCLKDIRKVFINFDINVLDSFSFRDFTENVYLIQASTSLKRVYSAVNIRSIEKKRIAIVAGTRVIDEIEYSRGCFEAHPGAIYLHQAESYLIRNLDFRKLRADCHQTNVDYFTRAVCEIKVNIKQIVKGGELKKDVSSFFGIVRVKKVVSGYRKIYTKTQTSSSVLELHLPALTKVVSACWIELGSTTMGQMGPKALIATHSLGHLLRNLASSVTQCDKRDINYEYFMDSGSSNVRVFLFEEQIGGMNLSLELFHRMSDLMRKAHLVINSCSCEDGCNGCILDDLCFNNEADLSKRECAKLLNLIVSDMKSTKVLFDSYKDTIELFQDDFQLEVNYEAF